MKTQTLVNDRTMRKENQIMHIVRRIHKQTNIRNLLLVAMALAVLLSFPAQPVAAATITISDEASCEAAGGAWNSNLCLCQFDFNTYTVNAGDTLQVNAPTYFYRGFTNNGTVNNFMEIGVALGTATNNGTININGYRFRLRAPSHNTSTGIINVNSGTEFNIEGTLLNNGVVTINSGGTLSNYGTITNNGTIRVACGGIVMGTGTVTGNPVQFDSCDNTLPTITLTTPAQGAVYLLGQAVTASYSCADSQAGVAACVGTVANGASIDTGSVGVKTFSVNARDNAGNTSSQSVTYRVAYNFVGFTSPVDNPPVMNSAKAGQAIPLKWRLLNASGAPVTNLASTVVKITAVGLSCAAGTTIDQIEEYAAGESGLQNLGNGYYQWNWKSPASYASSCKTLKLDLGEGTGNEHIAMFQFK